MAPLLGHVRHFNDNAKHYTVIIPFLSQTYNTKTTNTTSQGGRKLINFPGWFLPTTNNKTNIKLHLHNNENKSTLKLQLNYPTHYNYYNVVPERPDKQIHEFGNSNFYFTLLL